MRENGSENAKKRMWEEEDPQKGMYEKGEKKGLKGFGLLRGTQRPVEKVSVKNVWEKRKKEGWWPTNKRRKVGKNPHPAVPSTWRKGEKGGGAVDPVEGSGRANCGLGESEKTTRGR